MFEGLVSQLISGYLGRYIKDFQKEQLKITIWNEEVLLTNVELMLEAFEYLQLPFSLKQGRVGRLSIKIPWKKLGWDPVIIALEDVYISVGQRGDHEWNADAVEKREWAGKKAKLVAAELAKVSRRVRDNQTGQTFVSHIAGKIMENIQVSIRNVHILYYDGQDNLMKAAIGLRFSSLTIVNESSSFFWSSSSSQRLGQVIDIQGLGLYCNTSHGSLDLDCPETWLDPWVEADKYHYIVAPFYASLLVVRSGKLEHDSPQYSVMVQLEELVMSIDPGQLQHIFTLLDYVSTCRLREKYGRYRPWESPLSSKQEGWQKIWWRYAIESVLIDVRKKLKKMSWRYLDQRLACRRKYVQLYKIKLNFLQNDQSIDKDVLGELEQIEKDNEISDILNFRSIAEKELQGSALSSSFNEIREGSNVSGGKLQSDETSFSKGRGWLNWLSRGVLGVGGTDDSGQFSGVVSDEIIKDICEATKFQPASLTDDVTADGLAFLAAINLKISQISLSVHNMLLSQEIGWMSFKTVVVDCKVSEDSAAITTKIDSAVIMDSLNHNVILQLKQKEQSLTSIQVEVSPRHCEADLLVKVMFQPLEVYCDLEFVLNFMEFYHVLKNLNLQQDLVTMSLNGIKDDKSRILSKAEFIFSYNTTVLWDVSFINLTMHLPCSYIDTEPSVMVVNAWAVSLSSNTNKSSCVSDVEHGSFNLENVLESLHSSHLFDALELKKLYTVFQVSLNFEIRLSMPSCPNDIYVLEKSSASGIIASCGIPQEVILAQLVVHVVQPLLHLHFSPTIYGSILKMAEHLNHLYSKAKLPNLVTLGSSYFTPASPAVPYCYCIAANLELVKMEADLEDDGTSNSVIMLSLGNFDLRYLCLGFEEASIYVKSLEMLKYAQGAEVDGDILLSSHFQTEHTCAFQHAIGNKSKSASGDGCLHAHYKNKVIDQLIQHTLDVCLHDSELHCHPRVFALLNRFANKMAACHGAGGNVSNEPGFSEVHGLKFSSPCLSSFYEFSGWSSICSEHFPFSMIFNSCSLRNLEGSLIHLIPKGMVCSKGENKGVRTPSETLALSLSKFPNEANYPLLGSLGNSSFTVISLNVTNFKLHFHDMSCVVGTITFPLGKSCIISHADSLDVLCSIEGLSLSSLWWTKNSQECLWGPSIPNQSPILNLSFRKGNVSSNSDLELSISVQDACCIIPPEYLAILIGYFSLSDWSSKENNDLVHDHADKNKEVDGVVIYKFEVLNSSILCPVEDSETLFLKLESPQLYCSFIQNDSSDNLMNGVSSECMLPTDKIGNGFHALNLFGRGLHLSLLSKCCSSLLNECCTLIQSLSADLWVRIPSENESLDMSSTPAMFLMARIMHCELLIGGHSSRSGFDALLEIINQYSTVEKQSKCFNTDVPQFLQLKSLLLDNSVVADLPSITHTEIKVYADPLSVILCQSSDSNSREMVAKLDAGVAFSASLENEVVSSLDAHFPLLVMHSLLVPVTLLKCSPASSVSPSLRVHLRKTEPGKEDLIISLPSLDVWMHWFDWIKIVNILNSYFKYSAQAVGVEVSNSIPIVLDVPQDSLQLQSIQTSYESKNLPLDGVAVTIKSENVSLSCHIPVWGSKETFSELENAYIKDKAALSVPDVEGIDKLCKFLTINFNCKYYEILIRGTSLKWTSNFEKTTGSMEIWEFRGKQSWPLFQLSHVCAEIETFDDTAATTFKADIRCDTFDIWLSHQLLYFWGDVQFENANDDSSEILFLGLDLSVQWRKISILLNDGTWSCNGPVVELVMRNVLLETTVCGSSTQSSVVGDLLINYNNIRKVLWEPFMEPWNFHIFMSRKYDKTIILDGAVLTDVRLESAAQINLNITEPFVEVLFRVTEVIKDSQGDLLNYMHKNHRFLEYQGFDSLCTKQYAPYIIHNLTSLPFVFYVYEGLIIGENIDVSALKQEHVILPGSSFPICVYETLEEQVLNYRPGSSSDELHKKQSNVAGRHFISIQFEGSVPSEPISMDLVGLTYFEVDFSKDTSRKDADRGFLVPVVFDVSVDRYSKVLRLYSTVLLLNLTSAPLELRFDIPFGLSPKIVDPIYPGQEFYLPLHLAEVGHIRWRPVGDNYLWSESYNLSSVLSLESRAGFMRSLVCYPAHPNSDPFRCCLSVQDLDLLVSGGPKKSSPFLVNVNDKLKQTASNYDPLHNLIKSRCIHRMIFSTPLLIRNFLLQPVSLKMESGGVSRLVSLSEVETSFFSVDSSHDLSMILQLNGFKPSSIKFPRAETFSLMAKSSGRLLSLTETITFDADSSEGVIHVAVEKTLDATSGARELRISVPFLLYNCTGSSLSISRSDHGLKGHCFTVPSCYDVVGCNPLMEKKDGLGFLSSETDSYSKTSHLRNITDKAKSHVYPRTGVRKNSLMFTTDASLPFSSCSQQSLNFHSVDAHESPMSSLNNILEPSGLEDFTNSEFLDNQGAHVQPFLYSPDPSIPASEIMVRICRFSPERMVNNQSNSSWSNSFLLVAPSGSTSVLIPESLNSASVISVTSHLLDNPFSGITRAISFQPRYVISNACSKDLSYKQKGTEVVFHLGVGQHCHLHWPDITRELLISVRSGEPGWQWSGSFSPDHLGDTQVKMRNYISGALHMIRVEVQNADVIQDEKLDGITSATSGTILILLSDDDSGFIPYRIDNFSKESLRIYQQQCEFLETIVHPYTSCSYSWDEPCYPHRLIVEVPGERIIGAYALDDVKEYPPVHLPSSFEKRERMLVPSVHAEGTMKVLSIVDSTCHVLRDAEETSFGIFGDKKTQNEREQKFIRYKDNVSVTISFLGMSFINSSPQEFLYASAKDIKIDFSQNLEQQQLSFQILSLQIDNQLRYTAHPITLYFDQEHKKNLVSHVRSENDDVKNMNNNMMPFSSGTSSEPVICFSAAKWRNKDIMLVSFEHISLRIADFHLEVDQELLLILLDFIRVALTTFHSPEIPNVDSGLDSNLSRMDSAIVSDACTTKFSEFSQADGRSSFSKNNNFLSGRHANSRTLPNVVPIGAPWQKIYLLARKQNKIYVESFHLAPVKLTLSFSSNPRMLKSVVLASGESLIHRSLLALADIEGAQIYLRNLTIAHHIGSWESMTDIFVKHYSKEFLHEMYKLFGSAGVIGNPLGFVRRMGLGIKDFLSVPAQGVLQSPAGLITGVAQGTGSLLSNTLYAISDAATQFSKAAHKGVLAFTFDTEDRVEKETQQIAASSYSKGVISELLEGLTGLLQSPIRGAEKHGLPGVFSGFAQGVTGLVAKPAASVLEATGKTAQSIRNRSKLHRMGNQHLRVRLPRPLRRDLPLRPYSWEEAVGTAVLIEADDGLRFKDDVLVICKSLKSLGRYVVVTQRLVLIVECPSLAELGSSRFRGISADPEWIIEVEISLESVIHADLDDGVIHIVGSGSDTLSRQNQQQQRRAGGGRTKGWNRPTSLPLFQTNIELARKEDADYFLRALLSTIEEGKEHGWGNIHVLHQSNFKLR